MRGLILPFNLDWQAATALRRWAYELQQSLEGPMALQDWTMSRFEAAFKGAARHLPRQRRPWERGVIQALIALETAWESFSAQISAEPLGADVDLRTVSSGK